jgi:phosphoribosylanthranilate isomerase
MKVKICGITSAKDASMCEEKGADALGFVQFPGRNRSISLEAISEICSSLGPMTAKILVCAPRGPEDAMDMLERSGADIIQTYTLEPASLANMRGQGVRVFRAVSPIRSEAVRFAPVTDALVFEHGTPGTGRAFDYSRVPVDACPRSIIAGGLNLENLEKAKAMRPYALDVSSGVESSPGSKDPLLVAEFIRRAKE